MQSKAMPIALPSRGPKINSEQSGTSHNGVGGGGALHPPQSWICRHNEGLVGKRRNFGTVLFCSAFGVISIKRVKDYIIVAYYKRNTGFDTNENFTAYYRQDTHPTP